MLIERHSLEKRGARASCWHSGSFHSPTPLSGCSQPSWKQKWIYEDHRLQRDSRSYKCHVEMCAFICVGGRIRRLPTLVLFPVASFVSSSLCWPHGLQPARLLCPRDSPGKSTGVGCHALLQGIEPVSLRSSALAGLFFITSAANPSILLGWL